jgi:tricorn protease
VAFLSAGAKTFQNVNIVSISSGAAGAAKPVSFLANTNAGSVSWSADGTYLTYATSQRTEPGEVIRIDLLPRTPKFREDQFRDLFKDERPSTPPAPPAPTATASRAVAVEINYDEIRRRASVLPVGVDVTRQELSPDGKWLLLTAAVRPQARGIAARSWGNRPQVGSSTPAA